MQKNYRRHNPHKRAVYIMTSRDIFNLCSLIVVVCLDKVLLKNFEVVEIFCMLFRIYLRKIRFSHSIILLPVLKTFFIGHLIKESHGDDFYNHTHMKFKKMIHAFFYYIIILLLILTMETGNQIWFRFTRSFYAGDPVSTVSETYTSS